MYYFQNVIFLILHTTPVCIFAFQNVNNTICISCPYRGEESLVLQFRQFVPSFIFVH